MSQTRRLSQLYAAESWLNNYRYLVNADFKAYDFESLREALLNYIQLNYPEDFNDFINSSEYVALVDLLSFMGQNLAFRADLNLRESFLETAEVRENVLNIARQLGYRPFRNTAARGFLRINAIQTTQNIYDSRNRNLAGQTIVWADPLNLDFNEQFSIILNEVFNKNNPVGRPVSSSSSDGTVREIYELDQPDNRTMVETFDVYAKNNNSYPCEITPMTIDLATGLAVEKDPDPYGHMTMLFNNDGTGYSNTNNGWFFMFVQGNLRFQDYKLDISVENRVIDIDNFNINETDVWVQNIDGEGRIIHSWSQVPSVIGKNIIFNSIDKDERYIYEIVTRGNDTISVKFGDGNYANIPTDNLRIWFRQSANESFVISRNDADNIEVAIRYVDSTGNEQTLICSMSLNADSVSLVNETLTQIKNRASRTAASQDRMITASDYNVYPEGKVAGIEKIKSINRTHAGMSVYSDIQDATGTYRPVISIADDTFVYSVETVNQDTISSNVGTNKIYKWLQNTLLQRTLHQLYYQRYSSIDSGAGIRWVKVDSGVGYTHGYFETTSGNILRIGRSSIDSKLRTVKKNTLFKIGNKWSRVLDIYREGTGVSTNDGISTGLRSNGEGAVFVSGLVESGNIIDWFPMLRTNFTANEKSLVEQKIKSQTAFGLRYDPLIDTWKIIEPDDIIEDGPFDQEVFGKSWLVRMSHNSEINSWTYTVRKDLLVFGSYDQLAFHNQRFGVALDQTTQRLIKDSVTFYAGNLGLEQDITLDVSEFFVLDEGRYDPKRVGLCFPGLAENLVPDDPTAINLLIGSSEVNLRNTEFADSPGQFTVQPIPEDDSQSTPINTQPVPGRTSLKAQYNHVPLRDNRVDSNTTNIIDMFVLTTLYDQSFRSWISTGQRGNKPLPMTTYELGVMMNTIQPFKSVSDSIVFHPVKYKMLFGSGADMRDRAIIRVTKSDGTKSSNAEIKSMVISALDDYFDAINWDFGETFYFTDMAAWIHRKLAGVITSIVLVPMDPRIKFNNLLQIRSEEDELMISTATVNDVEIITTQQIPLPN